MRFGSSVVTTGAGLHLFTMNNFEPGGPPAISSAAFFKEKRMRVGLPYLAIGVCAIVAAWLVMNWLV